MASFLLSYDIGNDRLRDKTAKILLRNGCRRVQKSVFFAPRFHVNEMRKLRAELRREIGPELAETDSLLCVPVAKNHLDDFVWEGDRTFFDMMLQEVLVKMF